jgi:MoaA/NifB/PqqE/SkfB family radical SAM enzyme
VPYTTLNPVSLELKAAKGRPQPEGAGKAWLYIEPDGDVLPGQGLNKKLGNMVKDEWKKIWKRG